MVKLLMLKVKKIRQIIVLFLIPLSLFSIEISNTVEYYFSIIDRKESILNPQNILLIPDNLYFLEYKTNFYTKFFNTDFRLRYDNQTNSIKTYFDQGYIDIMPKDFLRIRLGRQRVGFGVGYLWNPVNDLDLRKDVYEPTKYNYGVDGLKIGWNVTQLKSIPLNINFEIIAKENKVKTIEDFKFGLQTYTLINETELGIVSSYTKEKFFGENILFGMYSSVDIKGTI
ncbi:MAG: hypothetical protein SNJ64_03215, partial [Endomicrobiia bacterium]